MAIEYVICEELTIEELCETVNYHIEHGWIPQGGVCAMATLDFTDSPWYFYQAMIKGLPSTR